MTAKEIYKLACSFLFERPGEDADTECYYLGFLNLLMEEALPYENSVRRAKGEEPLPEAPTAENGDFEVPYCPAITKVALPYGLAGWFFQDIADNFQAENYRNKYITALNDAKKCFFVKTEDAYPEEG